LLQWTPTTCSRGGSGLNPETPLCLMLISKTDNDRTIPRAPRHGEVHGPFGFIDQHVTGSRALSRTDMAGPAGSAEFPRPDSPCRGRPHGSLARPPSLMPRRGRPRPTRATRRMSATCTPRPVPLGSNEPTRPGGLVTLTRSEYVHARAHGAAE
jgi:hypothetical protein